MRHAHAIVRAKERYSLDLTESDLDEMIELIQENRARVIGYMEDGRTVWKLKWRDYWLKLVVDKTFYDVITFLPKSGPLKPRPSASFRKRA